MKESDLKIELDTAKKRITELEASIKKYERIVDFYSKVEDEYKVMFDAVYAGIIIQNNKGVIIYANKIANEILSSDGDNIEGRNSFDEDWGLVDSDSKYLPNYLLPSNITLKTGKPQFNEVIGVFSNEPSKMKWLVVNTHPIFDKSTNSVEKIYITFNDITSVYQIEREKHEYEEKFSVVFNDSSLPMAIVSDLEIENVNSAFLQLFGYNHISDLNEMPILEFFHHSNHIELLENHKQRTYGHNTISNFQMKCIKKNRQWFDAEVNISSFKYNNTNKTIFYFNDVTQKNIYLQNLLESEHRFRNMVENLPLGIVYKKNNKLILNKTCEIIIGFTNNEVDDLEKWFSKIYGTNKNEYSHYYEKFQQMELPNSMIIPIFNKYGYERFVEFVIYNSDFSQIWILNDVTEKLTFDRILKESETKYRLLFENMMSAFALHQIIVDENNKPIDYKFIEVNSAFELQTGLKRENIINRTVLEVMPFTENFWIELYGNVALTGKPIRFENYSAELDKHYDVYAYSPQKNQFATIFNDVTSRKQFELELNRSEEKYRTLVENAFDAIYILKGRRYEYVNHRYCELLGYSFEELTSSSFDVDVLLNEHSRKIVYDRYERRKANLPVDNQYELQVIKKNGDSIDIEVSTVAIGSQDEDVSVLGIVRDITLRKKADLELIKSKENAELLNRIKTNFISNLSHELRTPLNGILGFSKILSIDIIDSEQAEMCNLIYENGKRLLTTLNQLLDLSKIESKKFDLIISTFNVYNSIDNQLDLFKTLANSKSIQLTLQKPVEDIFATLDETLFTSIVSNIVGNAVKFTNKGKIVISISEKLIEEKKELLIEIEDTGIGIPEDRLDIIFEEFRQVSEGFSRSYEGTGLGLTIAKKYTEIMNGNISVKSKLEHGSKFIIRLPLSIDNENHDKNITIIDNSVETLKYIKSDILPKLLYLEDDFSSLLVVREFLRGICTVEFCRTGEEALQLSETKEYDLFLLDINLGNGLSGFDVVDRLRQSTRNYLKPIIAITAYSIKYEQDDFIECGFNKSITKPFDKKYLVNVIKEYLKIN